MKTLIKQDFFIALDFSNGLFGSNTVMHYTIMRKKYRGWGCKIKILGTEKELEMFQRQYLLQNTGSLESIEYMELYKINDQIDQLKETKLNQLLIILRSKLGGVLWKL